MDIRIYIRHLQMFNIYGQPIIYTGPNPQSLVASPGNVPQTQWIDVTDDVGNRDKIRLGFSMEKNTTGITTPGAFQPKKSVTNNLLIEGAAHAFIKAWLIDHVAAPLNAIDVKIKDTGCGYYENYSIKCSQITWCEDGICQFDVTLKQSDSQLQCIQKTIISDNWQGMFQTIPANGKKHPRFSYCNEIRPNSTLVLQWWLTGVVVGSTMMVMIPMILLINSLIFAINGIILVINAIINAISSLFGGSNNVNPLGNAIPFIDLNDIVDSYRQYYVESAGCGREHPAPLIRDYIKNVCDKCGIEVDAVTAPIFFADHINIQASTRNLQGVPNPHYNACYLSPALGRGIRRFKSINYFGSPAPNDLEFYAPDNAPLDALDEFLDKIKAVYNAEWRVKAGKLYFWRKDWFLDGGYLYDFTENGADRHKILEGVCFEWNEVKYPARTVGLYSPDAADTAGNEALRQMNGYAMFGNIEENPNFDGKLDKTVPHFGGTKFRFDGASTDYIYDAMQVVCNGQILQPWTIPQMKDVDDWMQKYANYALLMSDETCTLGKIIIWDGESHLNAKAIRNVVPVNNNLVPSDPTPVVNPKYNALQYIGGVPQYQDWHQRHHPDNFVKGAALAGGSAQTGEYKVADYFGSLITHAAARLVNYPMYFEPGYLDTLWDWFHWIDDPRANPAMNMNWSVKIELCCEDVERLKVLNDASEVKLLEKVKVPAGYYQDGILKEIQIVNDSTESVGKHIQLKGTV